ncbi:MAG: 4-amino-4-deoxy-L-arabinose transferase-like glycosyltransferase [Verrucomicrobiales bacterium]|jgi:4-amino-4-deoxy-L-arabinose transferase-like glycosyltransferase
MKIPHLFRVKSEDRPFYLAIAVLLVFYAVLVLVFSPEGEVGDEDRYIGYAENLSNGFYVNADRPDFTNGPVYPVILTPLVMMDAPLIALRMLNIFFLAGAVVFFYRAARLYISPGWALAFSLILGLNPIQLRYIAHAKTEAVSVFFFCAFLWALAHFLKRDKWEWKWAIGVSVFFALLALTRVLFGYVATAGLLAIPVGCFIFGHRQQLLKAVVPFGIALVLCLPWLSYTYKYTGQYYCWSTNGGELLYWITSPYEGEWGSWFSLDDLSERPLAAERHAKIMVAIESARYVDQDVFWKKYAMENVRENPKALARNLAANFNRIFFAFPRSYRQEELKTIFWIVPSGITLFLAAFAVYPTIKGWRRIPLVVKISGMIGLIFFCGSVLLPAEPRYLLPVVPAMLFWLAFVYDKLIQIRITPAEAELTPALHGRDAP